MKHKLLAFLLLLALPICSLPVRAQDVGRVAPASLPPPLPAATPLPPNVLRAQNPWTLEMVGTWRFALTHGHTIDGGQYVSDQSGFGGITTSSNENQNPPQNAFDGDSNTRWCASDNTFPQWLQVDLGRPTPVQGMTLAWERPNVQYQYKIEVSADGKHWKTVANKPASASTSEGPVAMSPVTARFVKIVVLGASDGSSWASIREWQINVVKGGQTVAWRPSAPKATPAAAQNQFASLTFDDSTWDNVPVPSNWEMLGYSIPTYNGVDNTVGQYRRWVTIPASWAGRRILWHFDGALDGAEVYVNGRRAGYHESGYTAWQIDLTGLLHPGQRNLFAVRVSKTTPSVDCETGDFQCMGGIFRENYLVAVPQTHIAEITVRTPLAPNYKDATLNTLVQVAGTPGEPVRLTAQLFTGAGKATPLTMTTAAQIGAGGTTTLALSKFVKSPKLWSAEKPNLYYVVFGLTHGNQVIERAEQRFGFRQIEIKNNIVLWNGVPIKCTGTCRHDEWADKGWALTDTQWNKDLNMMKAANINAIRTSHYNHAERFLELCDEKGMYILDEVPYCWIGDQVKDPKYAPYLLQRAAETVSRDKNKPCVLAWSIGNENPAGVDSDQVIALVNKTDPTRPAFVSCTSPNDIPLDSWEDDHYPGPGDVDRIAANTKWGANFSEHPHIFYQKETQDYDPGASDLWSEALMKTWDKLWKDPTILGSFIWEWQNQGIADKYPDKTRDFWYGPDHLRQENNKGIVTAYRVPKPEWWIVKMVYAKVVVGTRTVAPAGGACAVPLTNHFSFTNLNELTCRWAATNGNAVLKKGVMKIDCAPLHLTTVNFPAPDGMTALHLEFDNPDGSLETEADLAVEGAPLPAPPAALAAGDALATQDGADALTVSNTAEQITFNKATGTIQSWRVHGRDIVTGGPILNLGGAKAGDGKSVYHADQPPATVNGQVAAAPQPDGTMQVSTTSDVLSGPGGKPLGTLACTYDIKPDAEMTVHWTLNWTASSISLWEEGLKMVVPTDFSQMRWLRDSFFTAYPPGHLGEPSGTCRATDVKFRASKRDLHWLTLTSASGVGVALLPSDTPLAGRAETGADGTLLFASSGVAGPWDFSGAWVSDHDIHANQGKTLTGAFILRALAP